TLREVDAIPNVDGKPETKGVNIIRLKNANSAVPSDITIDPTGHYAFVSNEVNSKNKETSIVTGEIYVIDIDPESDTYNQHIATLQLSDLPKASDGTSFGLRGLVIAPDGKQVVALAPSQPNWQPTQAASTQAGKVVIFDLPDLAALGSPKAPALVITNAKPL